MRTTLQTRLTCCYNSNNNSNSSNSNKVDKQTKSAGLLSRPKSKSKSKPAKSLQLESAIDEVHSATSLSGEATVRGAGWATEGHGTAGKLTELLHFRFQGAA